MAIAERFKNAWSAFMGRDPTYPGYGYFGNSHRPDKRTSFHTNEKSIIGPIYGQISVDASLININHVKVDENDRFTEIVNDDLNRVITFDANIDQTGRELIREGVANLLSDGYVAIVPIRTSENPRYSDSFKIYELRVGKILEWYPRHVRVEIYDEDTGQNKQILVEKRIVVIVENPFYDIMNKTNSTMQRLRRTLSQLDRSNEFASSGKLDLIIQLPYATRTESREKYAEKRRASIEAQLVGSQHGIAYTEGTEKIVQLNRSLENNLWNQVKELKEELYSQLGLSKAIFDGTADEQTMLNYTNRSIKPILLALTEEMERKWISRTARSQGHRIKFFTDPFSLVPVSQLAELSDKLTRNEIMTSNEIRSIMGLKPSDDPKADQLINSNLNHPDEGSVVPKEEPPVKED